MPFLTHPLPMYPQLRTADLEWLACASSVAREQPGVQWVTKRHFSYWTWENGVQTTNPVISQVNKPLSMYPCDKVCCLIFIIVLTQDFWVERSKNSDNEVVSLSKAKCLLASLEKFSLLISIRQNFSDSEKVTGMRHLLFKSWASSSAGIRCFAVNAHTPSSRYSNKVLLIISPSQWGWLRLSKRQAELVLNINVIKLYLLQQVRRGCARMTQFASFTAIDQMSLDNCSVAFLKVPFRAAAFCCFA